MSSSYTEPARYYEELFRPATKGYVRLEPIWRHGSKARQCIPEAVLSVPLPDDFEGLAAEIAEQDQLHVERGFDDSRGVYVTANVCREEVGGAGRTVSNDVIGITALRLDIDCKYGVHKAKALPLPTDDDAAMAVLESFPLAPSAVVRSGGGLYVEWYLTDMLPVIDGVKPATYQAFHVTMQRLFREAGLHLDSTVGLTQLYRAPGSTNTKGDRADVVEVVEFHPERRYTELQVDAACDVWVPPALVDAGMEGTGTPGNDYSAQVTTEDIEVMLEEVGFHDRQEVGLRIDYVRPSEEPGHRPAISVFPVEADSRGAVSVATWSLSSEMVALGFTDGQRGYTPFQVKTILEHDGDHSACARALAEDGYGDGLSGGASIDHLQPIDFTTLREEVAEVPMWWTEPLIAHGSSTAINAHGGDGKSLILLEMAAARATGKAVLEQPSGEPEHVVYVDQEMGKRDLAERLESLGYDFETDAVLQEHLHYYQLQDLAPLDTLKGGAQLLGVARRHTATAVLLDTFIRVVEGRENDSDTVANFHRYTGRPLKSLGITVIRADHLGKNTDAGSRGSSAKNDDVDVVWQMSVRELADGTERITLTERKRRMAWVPEQVVVDRLTEPHLHHRLRQDPVSPKAALLVEALDNADKPIDITVKDAKSFLRSDREMAFSNDDLSAALKHRQRVARVADARGDA